MAESKRSKAERENAIERLREFVTPGMTVYTTLRHRSSSGMFRVIDLHVIRDGEPWWIGGLAATALGMRFDDRRQGLRVSGCGMDMGFHVVYALSRVLFRESFLCIGERCPSNDHSNGDRDRTPHAHSDGGYALRHRWM